MHRINLAPNPSFGDVNQGINGWYPVGIVTGTEMPLSIANTVSHTGSHSMFVKIGPAGISNGTEYYSSYNAGEGTRAVTGSGGVRGVRTIAYRLDRDIRSFLATAWVKSKSVKDIQVKVKWYARNGRKRPVELVHIEDNFQIVEQENDWSKYEMESIRPHCTHQAQFCIETTGDESFYVDDVNIELPRYENLHILVDQLGYEKDSKSKYIYLQSSTSLDNIPRTFQIIELDTLNVVFEGDWIELGYHQSFDRYYWRGDLNDLQTEGDYIAETHYGKDTISSVAFKIQDNLINQVTKPAYEFFYYQRCGMEIPGFHKACHTDDAVMLDGTHRNLAGGWHDAGDYNKYNGYTPESFYALALAHDRKRTSFEPFDRDGDGICDILDEAIWGAEYLRKCLDMDTGKLIGTISTGIRYWGKPEDETDNIPSDDDRTVTERYGNPAFLVGGFALIGKYLNREYIKLAETLYRQNGGSIQDLIALFQATENQVYLDVLQSRIREAIYSNDGGMSQFRELAEFAIAFPSGEFTDNIKKLVPAKFDKITSICDDYFQIRQYKNSDGKCYYFRNYDNVNDWYVGDSREMLDSAYEALLLEKLGEPKARQIAENQIHWILGRNPFNTSLMEGVGKNFVPNYHHRYNTLPGNPRGAVIGAVLNGITRAYPWLDLNPIPTADFQSNEPWLPHNNRMLFVLSLW